MFQRLINRYKKDEAGATAIEYGLIAALIAVAIISGAKNLAAKQNHRYNCLAIEVNSLGNAGNNGACKQYGF